jgi:hypothetical protein
MNTIAKVEHNYFLFPTDEILLTFFKLKIIIIIYIYIVMRALHVKIQIIQWRIMKVRL